MSDESPEAPHEPSLNCSKLNYYLVLEEHTDRSQDDALPVAGGV